MGTGKPWRFYRRWRSTSWRWRMRPAIHDLMQTHHYLGAVPGMGETVRYVAHHGGRWLALAMFSAPALKCGVRDHWIGWDRGVQFGRLHLVTNNSRFLILPGGERNLGSRVLSLCTRRLVRDWPARFGSRSAPGGDFRRPRSLPRHRLPRRQLGPRSGAPAASLAAGPATASTRGPSSCSFFPCPAPRGPGLGPADLDPRLRHGVPKMTLSAAQMRSLPTFFFQGIDDPRRRQGRRHALSTVLALAAAATLCGMRGYKAISEWVDDLSPRVLQRFRVRRRNGQYRPAQPVGDAQPADPRQPGPTRRRLADVARSPWQRRQRTGHRRQDHPRRHR